MVQGGRSRVQDPMTWTKFSVYVIFPAALGRMVYLVYDRNDYQEKKIFLGSRARPVCVADNLTAICESIFYAMCDPQNLITL
jgi:hypothetical protein